MVEYGLVFVHNDELSLWEWLDSLDVFESVGTIRVNSERFCTISDPLMQ